MGNTKINDTAKEGSFCHYLYKSGDFVKAMANAIQMADNNNLERLRKAFPQMVAAHALYDWNEAPEGFEPVYNANL